MIGQCPYKDDAALGAGTLIRAHSDLCGVRDVSQGGVGGDHGSDVGEGEDGEESIRLQGHLLPTPQADWREGGREGGGREGGREGGERHAKR